ncbi:MAG: ribonuclease HI [Rickettsiales bacterium]|jgi:ribonuclease HI|nr:ribonuclease HI [Rickettsiales bacterium]
MLKVWTDGSCLGNPGNGGWAFVMTDGDRIAERSGGASDTTNNRMELLAVINALSSIKNHDEIELLTDSQYVKNGMESWLADWKKNGWKTSNKKPVANKDLWERLDELSSRFRIHWKWTRGHCDDEMNNRCDELARGAAESCGQN